MESTTISRMGVSPVAVMKGAKRIEVVGALGAIG